ncbi:hypothetical protein BJV74DRAFT_842207 [Russula compacta]|nr:hypothetical protein BJV74DRAFT_842207 [Russula compacta]
MQRAHKRLVKRQDSDTITAVPSASGVSGGETASSVDLGTSLLLGPSGSPVPSVSNPLDPNEPVITVTSSSTPIQTGTTSSSTHSSSISTGATVGIIVGVFLVLIGAMYAVYTYFKKRTASQARRPLARAPPGVRIAQGARGHIKDRQWREEDGDRGDSDEKPLSGTTNPTGARPDSGKFGLFEKDLSVRSGSDEKANISDDHSFDPSTMPNFANYQSHLDELSTLPPLPLAARQEGSPVVSWDGETVNSDTFRGLSLHPSAPGTMSSTAVTARQTPRATNSVQHRWESAEVVIFDGPAAERPSVYQDTSQNPFSDDDDDNDDDSPPRQSTGSNDSDLRSNSNPFFNASQHNPFSDRTTRSRKSSVSTAKRSRSVSVSSASTVRPGASEGALLSLIAALDTAPVISNEQISRTSTHTTASSVYPPSEGDVSSATPKAF